MGKRSGRRGSRAELRGAADKGFAELLREHRAGQERPVEPRQPERFRDVDGGLYRGQPPTSGWKSRGRRR
jgi:hypothetical protein